MKHIVSIFSVVLLLAVFCVPCAFASSGIESAEPVESDPSVETDDSLIPDTDLEGAVDPDSVVGGLGQFFDYLSIPTEIMKVFDGFADVWGAIPVVVRYTLISMFSIACLLAVVKMLF